jgi:hypothetical protein
VTHEKPKSKTSSQLLFALCASALIGGIACKKPATDETGATSQALAAEPLPGQAAANPSSVNPANPTPVDVPAAAAIPGDPAAGVAAGAGSGVAGIAPSAPAAPPGTDTPAAPPGTGTEKGLVGTPPKADEPKAAQPPKTEPPKTTPPKEEKKGIAPEPPKTTPKPADPKPEVPKTTPPKADEEAPKADRKVRDRKGVSAKRLPGAQD